MRKIFNHLIIITILTVTITGCKKFVDAGAPPTQMVTLNVFKNNSTATAAMQNIYVQMYNREELFTIERQTGLLSDELTDYSNNVERLQYYTNTMTPERYLGPWQEAYNFIFQANAVLEGLQNNNAITPAVATQLTGEAKFIRAFWNFYLTNSYGAIPLASTTSYTINRLLPRTPQPEVYQQIIKDLTDAQGLLSDRFIDASDTSETSERVRPNKWAATALLARVYLYTKKYASADAASSAVINNTTYFELPADLNSVFLANSREAIWQLGVPLPNLYNTAEGFNFILQGEPSTQSLSSQLINAFEPGDQRFANWVNSYTTSDVPPVTYYYPFKYKVFDDPNVTEYPMMLRLAEQYLIRAEARAYGAGTGLTGAISDLNAIRNRAGLPDYSGSQDQASVLAALLHERQVELFTEGHRWYDLIRTGKINSVMGAPGNVTQSKGGTWSPNWQLYPIPQKERDSDPNLTQNSGY